jgi:hypothetical protein
MVGDIQMWDFPTLKGNIIPEMKQNMSVKHLQSLFPCSSPHCIDLIPLMLPSRNGGHFSKSDTLLLDN